MRKVHKTNFGANEKRNSIPAPSYGGLCHQAWKVFDSLTIINDNGEVVLPSQMQAIIKGKLQGLNDGNLRTEFPRWKQFNGFTS